MEPPIYFPPYCRKAMKNAYLLFIILLSSSISGCTGEVEEATGEVEEATGEVEEATGEVEEGDTGIVTIDVEYSDARLEVSNGSEIYEILLKLNHTAAPKHADNFRSHILQGNYDGVDFHRIIDDFMIQGGDFENRDGTGGFAANWYGYCNGDPMADEGNCPEEDYTVPDEVDNGLKHYSCTISMAHAGSNTGGSQFFLIPGDVLHHHWLDGLHTVFGDVVGGCDYVTTLSETETDNDRPIVPVTISSAEVSEVYIETVPQVPLSGEDLSGEDLSGADLSYTTMSDWDLSNVNLSGANLNYSMLQGADLRYADLRYAWMSGANLSNADLTRATLSVAWLNGANLAGANLNVAWLNGANLYDANLTGADLTYAYLRYAILYDANLTGATLNGAGLWYSDLRNADLSNAKISRYGNSGANLTGANLSNAVLLYALLSFSDLSNANLSHADLSYTEVWHSNLSNADLSHADLSHADLSNANLSNADLSGTWWYNTICPDGTNSDDNGNTCANNL